MIVLSLFLILHPQVAPPSVQEYEYRPDIPYRPPSEDTNIQARCKLDLYFPKASKGFATVIWFHGGGLTAGEKGIPEALKKEGIAVVAPGYRLSPTVKAPVYIEDAAAAVAWVVRTIPQFGGAPNQIFVSGHSAGGYLASMVVLDKSWLEPYGIDPDTFAGLIPFSGQSITHYTVRKERGIPGTQPVIDKLAPLFHVRKDAPPILLLSGDREKELIGRYEESGYFWRMLKQVGHPQVRLLELQGYDHGGMVAPGIPLLLEFVRERVKVVEAKGA
jgi:acetyl esterase/lipase